MVNITDFKDEVVPVPNESIDRLGLVFKRQKELMGKYKDIYIRNGFSFLVSKHEKLDIHERLDQNIIKYYMYCTFEELGEALEAYNQNKDLHFIEELIDGLHFLTECSIYANYIPFGIDKGVSVCRLERIYNHIDWVRSKTSLSDLITDFVQHAGCAMNTLKQKPWKQSHMLTDEAKFNHFMKATWFAYIALLKYSGITPDQILATYYKKSEVNNFRQRSNY